MRVYSHSYWLAIFYTTINSPVLAREKSHNTVNHIFSEHPVQEKSSFRRPTWSTAFRPNGWVAMNGAYQIQVKMMRSSLQYTLQCVLWFLPGALKAVCWSCWGWTGFWTLTLFRVPLGLSLIRPSRSSLSIRVQNMNTSLVDGSISSRGRNF